MKRLQAQSGFSHSMVLLGIVIIGMLVFTGWFAWQRQNKQSTTTGANNTTDQKQTTTPTPKPPAAPPKLPEGWVTYENTERQISFAYPESWGTVTDSSSSPGRSYWIFESSSGGGTANDLVVGVHDKDIQHGDTDSPIPNIAGYTTSGGKVVVTKAADSPVPSQEIAASDVLYKGDDGLVYKVDYGTDGIMYIGLKKLDKHGQRVAIFYNRGMVTTDKQTATVDTIKQLMRYFKEL